MMDCRTRVLLPSDLDFAHDLSRLAAWNQTRRDWERFLSLAPEGCFLAEFSGEAAGTATTTTYGGTLAWIGMVLVHPDFRRRGVGTELLRRSIAHLREEKHVGCVRLDATPAGRPLYEGLGFQAEWGLRRWVRESETEAATFPLTTQCLALGETLLSLDRQTFGADRSDLLRSLAAGSADALDLPDGSFGLRREGERAHYLGPITAASTASGLSIAEQLAERCPRNRPLYWDLPDPNEAAKALAEKLGFQPVRELTRMRLGEAPVAAETRLLFGIAEPGLG